MGGYYYLFYSFIIYAFLGWVLEVIYHLYTQKTFVNRGFLHGPLCPMYGVTAVFVIVLLTPVRSNIFYVFIGGVAAASIIEYITGYILELLFSTRWWDYTDERFNIKGYICLKFSIVWGILSIIFIKFINPHVSKMTYFAIEHFGEVFYNILLVILIVDIVLTVNSLIAFNKVFTELQEVLLETKNNMDKLIEKTLSRESRGTIVQRIGYLDELKERLAKRVSLRHRAMLRAYPRISSKRFESAIQEIRKRLVKINRK